MGSIDNSMPEFAPEPPDRVHLINTTVQRRPVLRCIQAQADKDDAESMMETRKDGPCGPNKLENDPCSHERLALSHHLKTPKIHLL